MPAGYYDEWGGEVYKDRSIWIAEFE
jgi:hypothetical protein